MAHYTADIHWQRGADEGFLDGRYSRAHVWRFDGGVEVPASSSPSVVRLPFSRADAVDPEEAFVAALSSCHMLWFLSLAMEAGYCVDTYDDAAMGVMAPNAEGRLAMTEVSLRPRARFSGENIPDRAMIGELHHRAHDACFIAQSVKTVVRCEPVFD